MAIQKLTCGSAQIPVALGSLLPFLCWKLLVRVGGDSRKNKFGKRFLSLTPLFRNLMAT